MAKDLVLDVVAKASTRDLTLLAAEFDKLAHEVDDSGKSMQKHATFSAFLNDQIAKTKVQVKQLGEEFNKTGKADVFGSLKGAEKNLKSLEGLSKQLSKSITTGLDDAGAEIQKRGGLLGVLINGGKGLGKGLGKSFQTDFANVAQAASGGGIGGIAKALFTTPQGLAVAVPAAVIAGQVIGGALVTGIGLAGIGAGIALQLHNPQVQSALTNLKSDVGSGLKDASKSFAAPLVESIGIFDKAFKAELPGLEDTFKSLAPLLPGLARGATGFLHGVTTGLEDVAKASGPLVKQFSGWLPGFGNQIGGVFEEMARHSKEAQQGLQILEDTMSGLTIAGQKTIPVLSDIWQGLKYINTYAETDMVIRKIYGDDAVNATRQHKFHDIVGSVIDDLNQGRTAADGMAISIKSLSTELSNLITQQLDVAGANDAFQKGLNDLGTALDQNNHTLQGNSDAAIQNRDAIRHLITEAATARDKQIAMAGGANASKAAIDAANASYDAAIKKIEDVGVKAGLSKTDLDNLAGQYQIDVLLVEEIINHSGLEQSAGHPHDVNRYGSAGPPKRRAAGGPVIAGQPYWVGENGPELMVPNVSGTILPRVPPPVPYRSASSGGGGRVAVTVDSSGGDPAAALAPVVAHMIRTGAIRLSVKSDGTVTAGGGF